MNTIYLLRHIRTSFNHEGKLMGDTFDEPIVRDDIPEFKKKVSFIGSSIPKDSSFYSSPMLRCTQTIEILRDFVGVKGEIIIEDLFRETDYGDFEGKTWEEVMEEFPEYTAIIRNNISRLRFPGGENLKEVQERSVKGLKRVLKDLDEDETAVICTHVDVIKSLIFDILGVSLDKKKYLRIEPGSVTCLADRGNGLKVKFVNL